MTLSINTTPCSLSGLPTMILFLLAKQYILALFISLYLYFLGLVYILALAVHIYLALDIYLTYVYILALYIYLEKVLKVSIKLWGLSCPKNSWCPVKTSELDLYDFFIYNYFFMRNMYNIANILSNSIFVYITNSS